MNVVIMNSITKFVPSNVTFNVARKALILKKNSPHLFFGMGVVGSITGTVLACRATLKLPEVLDEIKVDIDKLKANKEVSEKNGEEESYDIYHKDALRVYGHAAFKVTKLYGPSVLISTASLGMLTGSHVQMTRRNSALMAAYAAVQKAYDDYRSRVREQLGEERELDFFHGARTEIVTNDLDEKKEVKVVDPSKTGPYTRIFDEVSAYWQKDAEYNRMFLDGQQEYLNQKLRTRGHVFLNDVFDMLDLERTSEGAVIGWLKDGGPDGSGEGHIDFGIYTAYNEKFVKGWERSVWLSFNPDGVIYDKI